MAPTSPRERMRAAARRLEALSTRCDHCGKLVVAFVFRSLDTSARGARLCEECARREENL